MTRYIGVDLAWGLGLPHSVTGRVSAPNETGLCVLDDAGQVLDAGWARGVDAVTDWISQHLAAPHTTTHGTAHTPAGPAIIAIDAPLIVENPTGMRQCERAVGRHYGRWRVSANASNQGSAARAGQLLLARLESSGIHYSDGSAPLPATAPTMPTGRGIAFECYPYTTIVGVAELGYDVERPRYKRLIPGIARMDARRARALACDDLVARLHRAAPGLPPLDLLSHPATAELVTDASPLIDRSYKHREDLLDAAICAWTAALWHRHGATRVQSLGASGTDHPGEVDARGRRATIVAPYRPEQRALTRG